MSTIRQTAKGRRYGFVEWFRPGEYERTEEILPDLVGSGASYLRTHLSWAEYLAPGGEAWFDWLLPRLGRDVDLLPCVHYTPPSLSRTGRSSGAPVVLKDYADFVDHVLSRYGKYFRHIELWNEPNNLLDWDWRTDSDFALFCEMIGNAAYWSRHRGWKPVLGGPCPFDPYWLDLMGKRGLLAVVDAVGFHGFPGTWDSEVGTWGGWDLHLGEMRTILDRYNSKAEIWITETGYSTWRNDEFEQARRFAKALSVPADRMYWYSWRDVPANVPVQEGLWFDPRHYHMGAVDAERVEEPDGIGGHVGQHVGRGRPVVAAGEELHEIDRVIVELGRPAHVPVVEPDDPEAAGDQCVGEVIVPADHLGAEPHDEQQRVAVDGSADLSTQFDAVGRNDDFGVGFDVPHGRMLTDA
jgi:CDP-paratose 2-epimerase